MTDPRDQYPRRQNVDTSGNDQLGAVSTSPAANTVLGRLKAIADAIGSGTAATTITNLLGVTAKGQATKANSIPVTLASDNPVVVTNDSVVDYTYTVAQGESESGEVNLLGGNVLAIFPADAVEATTTNLSLKTGRVAGTRGVIRDIYGTRKTIPFTVACPIMVPADEYKGLTYTSLVLETAAGVAVAQATAARTFIVRVGPVWKS